jgi:hypothetical protein
LIKSSVKPVDLHENIKHRVLAGEVSKMDKNIDRRTEQRLRYHWPIWFAEDFNGELAQGQMIDLSSRGAAFTYRADDKCPYVGQQLTARFSVPRFGFSDSFDMAEFTCPAHTCRVEDMNGFLRRIAIQFANPLPFKPGEQLDNEGAAENRGTLRPAVF